MLFGNTAIFNFIIIENRVISVWKQYFKPFRINNTWIYLTVYEQMITIINCVQTNDWYWIRSEYLINRNTNVK